MYIIAILNSSISSSKFLKRFSTGKEDRILLFSRTLSNLLNKLFDIFSPSSPFNSEHLFLLAAYTRSVLNSFKSFDVIFIHYYIFLY
jgi:hypothetical protein